MKITPFGFWNLLYTYIYICIFIYFDVTLRSTKRRQQARMREGIRCVRAVNTLPQVGFPRAQRRPGPGHRHDARSWQHGEPRPRPRPGSRPGCPVVQSRVGDGGEQKHVYWPPPPQRLTGREKRSSSGARLLGGRPPGTLGAPDADPFHTINLCVTNSCRSANGNGRLMSWTRGGEGWLN